jgi:hypothetical protein
MKSPWSSESLTVKTSRCAYLQMVGLRQLVTKLVTIDSCDFQRRFIGAINANLL